MNYLCPGAESEERLTLLLKFTNITSPVKIEALRIRYCKGGSVDDVELITGIDKSNFKKTCAVLEKVAENVELIKQHDWKGLVK